MADQTLAQRVKAKFPGEYDDWNDADLEKRIRAKYPGEYDDYPSTPAATAKPAESSPLGSVVDAGVGLVKGAVKGAANTVIGLGELVHEIPGVSTAVDAFYSTPGLSKAAFPAARQAVKPEGTAQQVGNLAEQVGEFFTPTGVTGKAAKAAEVAKAYYLSRAQGASPTASGVGAGLTAVLPGGGAAAKAGAALEGSAEKTVARALGATKEWAKSDAAKIAPEMLERGIKGSRPQMLEMASQKLAEIGQAKGAEIAAAGARGETVAGTSIRQAIDHARQTLMVPDAAGAMQVIPGTEPVINRLDKLDRFVTSLGPDIPVDKADKIKTVWDKIVSKAGLYGQKVGASSTDSANAWATREASSSFRKLIATGNPTVDSLNKEYAFWKGLKSVLEATKLRTQSQGAGLTSVITGGAGATIGGLTGDSTSDRLQNAFIGGLAGRQLVKGLESAAFRTRISAPLKMLVADALASGSAARIEAVAKTVLRSIPAQMRPSQESQ